MDILLLIAIKDAKVVIEREARGMHCCVLQGVKDAPRARVHRTCKQRKPHKAMQRTTCLLYTTTISTNFSFSLK